MKDYVKYTEQLKTKRKEKEILDYQREQNKDKAKKEIFIKTESRLYEALNQWNGRYGIKIEKNNNPLFSYNIPVLVKRKRETIAEIRLTWGSWRAIFADDVDEEILERPIIYIKYLFNTILYGDNLGRTSIKPVERKYQYWNETVVDVFMEDFCEEMSKII